MKTRKKVVAVKGHRIKGLKPQKQTKQSFKNAKAALVAAANAVSDPLGLVSSSYRCSLSLPADMAITSCRLAQLSGSDRAWCFALLERNVRKSYERCGWGWTHEAKWTELFNPEASRYLVARITEQPTAFVHFRFDLEQHWAVLYCYEIHVDPVSAKKRRYTKGVTKTKCRTK